MDKSRLAGLVLVAVALLVSAAHGAALPVDPSEAEAREIGKANSWIIQPPNKKPLSGPYLPSGGMLLMTMEPMNDQEQQLVGQPAENEAAAESSKPSDASAPEEQSGPSEPVVPVKPAESSEPVEQAEPVQELVAPTVEEHKPVEDGSGQDPESPAADNSQPLSENNIPAIDEPAESSQSSEPVAPVEQQPAEPDPITPEEQAEPVEPSGPSAPVAPAVPGLSEQLQVEPEKPSEASDSAAVPAEPTETSDLPVSEEPGVSEQLAVSEKPAVLSDSDLVETTEVSDPDPAQSSDLASSVEPTKPSESLAATQPGIAEELANPSGPIHSPAAEDESSTKPVQNEEESTSPASNDPASEGEVLVVSEDPAVSQDLSSGQQEPSIPTDAPNTDVAESPSEALLAINDGVNAEPAASTDSPSADLVQEIVAPAVEEHEPVEDGSGQDPESPAADNSQPLSLAAEEHEPVEDGSGQDPESPAADNSQPLSENNIPVIDEAHEPGTDELAGGELPEHSPESPSEDHRIELGAGTDATITDPVDPSPESVVIEINDNADEKPSSHSPDEEEQLAQLRRKILSVDLNEKTEDHQETSDNEAAVDEEEEARQYHRRPYPIRPGGRPPVRRPTNFRPEPSHDDYFISRTYEYCYTLWCKFKTGLHRIGLL